jgi:hypothetical protein
MRTAAAALSLSCLLAVGSVPAASGQADTSAATAHRLMVRSGLSAQLHGLSAQMEADIGRNRGKADEKLIAALLDASKLAFRAETLQTDMTARIEKKLSVAQMDAALAWLESPAGRRVTRAEELGSGAFDEQSFAEYVRGLGEHRLAEKRARMLSMLVTVTDAPESVLATQQAIALGVAIGMDSLQPQERRLGDEVVRERVEQMLPAEKVKAALAQQLPMLYAYLYRDVSDADLGAYLRFLRSPAGKRYQSAITAAFVEGLGRASLRVGELVGEREHETSI